VCVFRQASNFSVPVSSIQQARAITIQHRNGPRRGPRVVAVWSAWSAGSGRGPGVRCRRSPTRWRNFRTRRWSQISPGCSQKRGRGSAAVISSAKTEKARGGVPSADLMASPPAPALGGLASLASGAGARAGKRTAKFSNSVSKSVWGFVASGALPLTGRVTGLVRTVLFRAPECAPIAASTETRVGVTVVSHSHMKTRVFTRRNSYGN